MHREWRNDSIWQSENGEKKKISRFDFDFDFQMNEMKSCRAHQWTLSAFSFVHFQFHFALRFQQNHFVPYDVDEANELNCRYKSTHLPFVQMKMGENSFLSIAFAFVDKMHLVRSRRSRKKRVVCHCTVSFCALTIYKFTAPSHKHKQWMAESLIRW